MFEGSGEKGDAEEHSLQGISELAIKNDKISNLLFNLLT